MLVGLNAGMSKDRAQIRRERLQEMITLTTKGNRGQFAELVGKAASQISDMLSANKSFGEKVARQIEERAGYPLGWLDQAPVPSGVADEPFTYGSTAERRNTSRRLDDKLTESNVTEGPALGRPVPLISWVRAGELCEAIDLLHPGDAEEWITVVGTLPEGSYALRIQGDSMEPRFPSGGIVIVDPERKPDNGSFVIAKVDGRATFKQLTGDGLRWYLKALNPAYPMIDCTEDMHICGVVVQMVQRLV